MDDMLIDIAAEAVAAKSIRQPQPLAQEGIAAEPPNTMAEAGLPPTVADALLTSAKGSGEVDRPLDILRMLITRRATLYAELSKLDIQIRILSTSMSDTARPLWRCKRCDHTWHSWTSTPPHICARCHSTGWSTEPKYRHSRRPGDPPAPSWKVLKPKPHRHAGGRRRPPSLPSPIAWPTDTKPSIDDMVIEDLASSPQLARDLAGLPPPPKASAFAPRPLARQLADLHVAESLDRLAGPPATPSPATPVDNPAPPDYADDAPDREGEPDALDEDGREHD